MKSAFSNNELKAKMQVETSQGCLDVGLTLGLQTDLLWQGK